MVAAVALMGVSYELRRSEIRTTNDYARFDIVEGVVDEFQNAEVPTTLSSEAATWWVMSRSIRFVVPRSMVASIEIYVETLPIRAIRRGTPAQAVEELVCSNEWVWDCGWALRTIYGGTEGCETGESNGSSDAVGTGFFQGRQWWFYGLWQIAVPLPPGNGYDWLFDPYLNTVEAHLKYLNGGKSHWLVCGRS